MTDSKYKCANCPDHNYCYLQSAECLRAYCERYNKMLEFIKNQAHYSKSHITHYKEIGDQAEKFLREIGEL